MTTIVNLVGRIAPNWFVRSLSADTATAFSSRQSLRGRGEYDGPGMGLAIRYGIVQRHRGGITALRISYSRPVIRIQNPGRTIMNPADSFEPMVSSRAQPKNEVET